LAAGLFQRAIVQSGAYQPVQPTLADAEAQGTTFATAAGCTDQSATCLRALPVATILAHQEGATQSPNLDGYVLPASIRDAIGAGTFNHVPVIEGSTHDEWRIFVAQAEAASGTPIPASAYVPLIARTLGISLTRAGALATRYPLANYSSPSVALSAVATDARFACPARVLAGSLAKQVPVFQYEFNDPETPQRYVPPVSFPTGAYHGGDVQFLFDQTTPLPAPPFTAGQLALSQTMVSYWTRFARAGTPNGYGPVEPGQPPFWPRLDEQLRHQELVPGTSFTATTFAADHQCSLFGG
jgi:para-nitrobenzyl esterase